MKVHNNTISIKQTEIIVLRRKVAKKYVLKGMYLYTLL